MARRRYVLDKKLVVIFRNMWKNLPKHEKYKCGHITASLCGEEASLSLKQLSTIQSKIIHNQIFMPDIVVDWLEGIQDEIEAEQTEQDILEDQKREEKLKLRAESKINKALALEQRKKNRLDQIERINNDLKDNIHQNQRLIQLYKALKTVCNEYGKHGTTIYNDFLNRTVAKNGDLKIKSIESLGVN